MNWLMFEWRQCVLLVELAPFVQQVLALPVGGNYWSALHADWIWCDELESDPKLRAGGRFGVSTDAAHGRSASLKAFSNRQAGCR